LLGKINVLKISLYNTLYRDDFVIAVRGRTVQRKRNSRSHAPTMNFRKVGSSFSNCCGLQVEFPAAQTKAINKNSAEKRKVSRGNIRIHRGRMIS
jgi:hypothetical protein